MQKQKDVKPEETKATFKIPETKGILERLEASLRKKKKIIQLCNCGQIGCIVMEKPWKEMEIDDD